MNLELHLPTHTPTECWDGAVSALSELWHECPVVLVGSGYRDTGSIPQVHTERIYSGNRGLP